MLGWLSTLPQNSEISLYMHVPFCRRLCWFCACRTQGTKSEDPVRSYAETLLEEIDLVRRHLPQGIKLSRLHWGGGTPTLLPADMIRVLAGAVFDAFPRTANTEFSVEIDPNEIDEARMDALAEAGLNRASIGVQDFDPEIQRIIGREQSFEVTRRAVDMIRDRGVPSVNADILYGLPDQTPQRISASVQKLLTLSPDRVALYGYAHVPWMARRQQMIPSEALPAPEERLALFETARELMVWDGYDELGIDHFARPGDSLARAARDGLMRRNFQGYTDDLSPALVGIGASSISRLPQGYAQNAPSTSQHVKAIREGRLSISRGHVFSDQDRLRARMIEALMCDFAISTAEMLRDHPVTRQDIEGLYAQATTAFPGMLEVSERGLTVPPDARPLTRMIARIFDAYDVAQGKHSQAV